MPTRRAFIASSASAIGYAAGTQPSLAITMDDVNWVHFTDPAAANARPLAAMQAHRVRLALFVIGRNVDNETGQNIVRAWKTSRPPDRQPQLFS